MSFDLLAEAQNDGFRVARKSTSRGGQYNGPCILPGCRGAGKNEDRLRIQPNQGGYGWFACSQCGAKGSGVDWLVIARGISKNEALQYVGWTPKDGSTPHFSIPANALTSHSTHDAPPKIWQDEGEKFVQYCVDALWSESGKEAHAYLHGRGLKDETIKAARLGYNPKQLRQSADKWGLQKHNKLCKGIVIPWFIDGELWRITIRDETVAKGEDGRYKQVKGGSNGLYLGDYLPMYDRPAILVEGEFDALSILQECEKQVIVCATGTTQGSHTTRWISALARKDIVLVAFDAERDKGDAAAKWWKDRLENYQRLRPLWSDANQMLQDGVDLWNGWILPGLTRLRNHNDSPIANVPATLPLTSHQSSPESVQAPDYLRTFSELSPVPDTVPEPATLKCLSIQQPWSWLIVNGHKDIENRDWSTSYRGPVLIHAGTRLDTIWFLSGQLYDRPLAALNINPDFDMPERKELYPTGVIVGIATLVDVVEVSSSPWFVGRYGFVFKDARPFETPIAYRGQLGLFDVPREIVVSELGQAENQEKPRETKNEIAPNASTVELIASVDELLDQGEYVDPLNFCSVCHALVDEIIEDETGNLIAYCAGHFPVPTVIQEEHKPMKREDIEKLYRDALPGWTVEVFTLAEWEARTSVQSVQTPVQSLQPDFWTELARRRAAFDPAKPVDWTRHGYARGKDGRWHAASSDYWKDNGYSRVRGRWQLPEEVSA